MIVISGALVLVALVLLVMGVLGANLPFVYGSIAVSTVSLLCLLVGILQRRGEPLPHGSDDRAPVEVPVASSVRSGSVAVAERPHGGSDTGPGPQDLLVRDHQDRDDADEQRWQADVPERRYGDDSDERPHGADDLADDLADEHQHGGEVDDERARRADAGEQPTVRLVRLPRQHSEPEPQDEGDDGHESQGEHDDEYDDEHDDEHDDEYSVGDDGEDEGGDDDWDATDDQLPEPAGTVLVVPGRPRYHVEGCRYLYGKSPHDLDLDQARDGGFLPCGVCKPDEVLAEHDRPADEAVDVQGEQAQSEPLEQPAQHETGDQAELQPARDEPSGQSQEAERLSLEETLFGEQADGEQAERADGEQVDGGQVDGGQVDGGQADGEQVDGEQVDGEQADGEQVDGEQLDEDTGTGTSEQVDGDALLDAAPASVERPFPDGELTAAAGGTAVAGAAAGAARGDRTSAHEQPAEKAADEGAAAKKKASAKKAPAKRAPAQKSPAQKSPAKKAPAKRAPVKRVPAERTAAQEVPARRAPAQPAAAQPPAAQAPAATPAVRRIKAVAAAPLRPAGAAPAVRRVSAVGAARPVAPPARGATPTPAPAGRTGTAAAPARGAREQVVVIPDRTRFHRAQCRFVKDAADASVLTRAAADRQGYEPCGVCKP